MNKQRVLRTSLVAILGFLACIAVPAVAQAHHINTSATCTLVANVPTVNYTVDFIDFNTSAAKSSVAGTVKIDGAVVKQVTAGGGLTWTAGHDARLTGSAPGTAGVTHNVVADFTWSSGGSKQTIPINKCPTPQPEPAIEVEKDGPASAYVGDQVTFKFKVTNTGNVVLTDLAVTDDKCAPVTKVPNGQNQFDPGDVWDYTCTTTITDAMGDELVNTVKACGEYGNQDVCDEDDHKTKIPKPAIALEKTGAATAAAGATFTYFFTATNTGNVTLTNVQLTDDKCQSTLTRVEPNLADATFDKGDEWHYTCTVVAPAGPAQVDNIAKVCGDYDDPTVDKTTVCDDDPHTFTVPPPGTPPSVTPNVVPPGTTPDGGVLPEQIVSGRAQLRGPSGCVKQAFRARVRGRAIASVTFFVDGRKVKTVRRGNAFNLKVNPSKYGLGRHKIVALVRFRAESGTKARRLPLTFRRCAQGAVAPRFTG